MTATASPPHATAPADDTEGPQPPQIESLANRIARNGDHNSDESSDSLSDLDDQFDDASEFTSELEQAVRINGQSHTALDDLDDEHPAKRQRTSTPPPRPKQKPVSPPWKKFEADGPTSFIENGRRKSGRTFALPTEVPTPAKRKLRDGVNGHSKSGGDKRTTKNGTGAPRGRPPSTGAKSTPSKSTPLSTKTTASANKKAFALPAKPSPTVASRRRSSPPPPPPRALGTRRSVRALRHENHDAGVDEDADFGTKSTRIRFRVKPALQYIPVVHPLQVNVLPGQTLSRRKVSENFQDYIQNAPSLEIAAGGWLDPTDDAQQYSEEQVKKDARIIMRVEEETGPGGLLSQDRSSLFVPEPIEEPSRQWAHMDHLIKQMANFRKLMVMEQQRHRSSAKRFAEACRDEWVRRQPKSEEQLEAEARVFWIGRYRMVVKIMAATWDNVRNEVNRRRLEEWEIAEQKRVKAALNEAVNMSEMRLQAHRTQADSEVPEDDSDEDNDEEIDDDDIDMSDEELDEDRNDPDSLSNSDDSDSDMDSEASHDASKQLDDDNMSSDGEEDDVKSTVSDEGLTQEQLVAKYANVPDLPTVKSVEVDDEEGGPKLDDSADTSDESVDMDDDMGSSDDDMGSGSEEGSVEDDDEDESSEEEGRGGLLGMLFGKSELKKLKKEGDSPRAEATEDVEMKDISEAEIAKAPQLTNGNHAEARTNEVEQNEQRVEYPKPTNGVPTTEKTDLPATSSADELPVDAPADPNEGNKPDAPATVPEPLQPASVENEIKNTIEDVAATTAANHTTADAAATITLADANVFAQANAPDVGEIMADVQDESPTAPPDNEALNTLDESRSISPHAQVPKTEVPFLLRGTLREYQHYGLDWLAGLYRNGTNGILADEMGLGKTIQTISLLAHLACQHEVWGPHLVIVPTSVMLNWEMEFKKWCPGFKVLSYYGSIEERKRKRQGWKDNDMWNVCITSYQIVLQDQQVFKRRQWHYMILDEAHNIKNFKSKRWQTLLGFNTRARLLLTGTPLQNNLTELWSLLFFLMPSENGVGGFADLAEFQDWFHKPESQILESGREQMDEEARAIIAKLHKVLRPYLLRRLKADVEKQMPAKYEHVEFCRLSRRQRELYDGFLARADTRDALSSGNYISVINCLMQLRKVCNHPDLFVERPIMTSFRQPKSVAAGYASYEDLVRKRLSSVSTELCSLKFLNLTPTESESLSVAALQDEDRLSAYTRLSNVRAAQSHRFGATSAPFDPVSVQSNIAYIERTSRRSRLEELEHCLYTSSLKRQERPVYGKGLTDLLTLDVHTRPHKPRPKVPAKIMSWFEQSSPALHDMVPTLDERGASMKTTIAKFACVTPAVVTRDLDRFVLGSKGVAEFTETDLRLSKPVRRAPFMPKVAPTDPWHEARMRLSIQFPDKRLLQYDCGKLQALDRLLRKLQAGGHRALIFTQMTKVLDILEQFLNIHGHKYLRLDGATKVEQRQILTDRFNNDTRILAFILSTRSGGLGINLTGADTVIFYDQDWNPAMDKQCQDRCHRIGQTRDVHIYRLVSEHTIEGNILRKASQKQMLDDVVIQEGSFTTDYLNKLTSRETQTTRTFEEDVVGDAMDRVLGGVQQSDQRTVNRVLEQAEDREDVDAARIAEKEIQEDEADFEEKPATASASGASSAQVGTPVPGDGATTPGLGKSNLGMFSEIAGDAEDGTREGVEYNAWGEKMRNIDDFLLATMSKMLEGTPLDLPKDKKKSKKKGKDTRKR